MTGPTVPGRWLKAFDAARDKRVNATGDLLLGINAHVNRDLPFVLAGMGLVRPDGESGKPDFDKANEFLNAASGAMMAELAAALRPHRRRRERPARRRLRDDDADPHHHARGSLAQRRGTGQRAQRAAARALVAQNIENNADAFANTVLLLQSYTPPLTSTTARDAYCAVHKGDAAPMAYPFGMPTPYDG